MRRILLISPLFPAIGGISVSVEKLRERLIADGNDVSTINVKFKNKILNNRFFLFIKFAIIPLIIFFSHKYDIIHCHVSGGYRKWYISLFKCLYRNAALLYTIHGDVYKMINDEKSIIALNRADGVICVQDGDSERLRAFLDTQVMLRDIPAFFFSNNNQDVSVPEIIISFIKSNSSPLIVVCGKVVVSSAYYDLYGLVDAAKLHVRLREKGYDSKMLMILIGDFSSKEQEAVVGEIKSLVGEDNNFMLSSSVDSMEPIFANTAIYLRPTKTDGDSLSVREALACGCPVLASNVSRRPEGTVLYDCSLDDMEEKSIEILKRPFNVKYLSKDYYLQLISFYDEVIH